MTWSRRGSFGAIGAIVAVADADAGEGLWPGPSVVAPLWFCTPRRPPSGKSTTTRPIIRWVPPAGDIEDAQARQLQALDGDEGVAEQLVHPADHQHRHPSAASARSVAAFAARSSSTRPNRSPGRRRP